MQNAEAWRGIFENWPEAIPREGLIITNFGETIAFNDFMVSAGIVLIDRERPDSAGARKVMIAYDAISAIKLTSILELARFQVMGFQPPM